MIRLIPFLGVLLLGGLCMWLVKDYQLQKYHIQAAQDLLEQRDFLIAQLQQALTESLKVQETNKKNAEANKEKLREALEENDSLRNDLALRPVIVRVKAASCPPVGTGDSDAAAPGIVSVEVAEDLRRDIFRLRESIIRDQAALKERDDWIALVSQYSLYKKTP